MAPVPDPEDIDLLVEAAKSRQKLPRSFADGLQKLTSAEPTSTERIFFDCGGPSAWVAYALTKKSADNTGHVSGKGRRQRFLARIDTQSIETRKAFANQLAVALEDDRERIERVLETTVQHARRNRLGRQSSVESSAAEAETPERMIVPPAQTLDRPYTQSRDSSMNNAADYFDNGHALVNASITECIQLFPPYLAGAIKRKTGTGGNVNAAVSMLLPSLGQAGCIMKIEVISSKIDHIARELFGAHLEIDNTSRYLYIAGGSMVIPDPRLILKGCRVDILRPFFGASVADAVSATAACRKEIQEGRNHTTSVSMAINRAADCPAELYAALRLKEGALLRARLFA